MFNSIKKSVPMGLLALFVTVQSGCVPLLIGAAAGVGGYVWVKGAIEQNLEISAEKAYNASIKALKKLKLTVIEDTHDHLKANITAEFSDGEKVNVDIDALTELTSKIRVRVGVMGDKAKSEMILNTIKKYL